MQFVQRYQLSTVRLGCLDMPLQTVHPAPFGFARATSTTRLTNPSSLRTHTIVRAADERRSAPRGTQRTGKLIDVYLFAGSLLVVMVMAVVSQANQGDLFSQVAAGKAATGSYKDPAARADWAEQESKDVCVGLENAFVGLVSMLCKSIMVMCLTLACLLEFHHLSWWWPAAVADSCQCCCCSCLWKWLWSVARPCAVRSALCAGVWSVWGQSESRGSYGGLASGQAM